MKLHAFIYNFNFSWFEDIKGERKRCANRKVCLGSGTAEISILLHLKGGWSVGHLCGPEMVFIDVGEV